MKANFDSTLPGISSSGKKFVHHLKKLGISHVLDIGSNSDRFASGLRTCGYDGIVYSVEQERSAYTRLVAKAGTDMRWIPLARQDVGAETNLAAPGFLDPKALADMEALKINVQEVQEQMIRWYLSFMPQIKLLLLDLSPVDCPGGAPDLSALNQYLVKDLSFSRIHPEPSCNDKIYYKPELPRREPVPVTRDKLALVISTGGSMRRNSKTGEEIGPQWFALCVQSWSDVSGNLYSVSETPPTDKRIAWLKTESRPSITKMLEKMNQERANHVLLTNADILLTEEFRKVLPGLDPLAVYYGARLDVMVAINPNNQLVVAESKIYSRGFDLFVLPPIFVDILCREKLIPELFQIGQPWWDYLMLVVAMAYGFPLKKLDSSAPLLVHVLHSMRYSRDVWLENGRKFIECVQRMKSDRNCGAAAVLTDLVDVKGSEEEKLHAMSRIICNELP